MSEDKRIFAEGDAWTYGVWVKREAYKEGADLPAGAEILYAVHWDGRERTLVGYIAPIEEQWLAVDWFGETTGIHDRAELHLEKDDAIEWLNECYWTQDSSHMGVADLGQIGE